MAGGKNGQQTLLSFFKRPTSTKINKATTEKQQERKQVPASPLTTESLKIKDPPSCVTPTTKQQVTQDPDDTSKQDHAMNETKKTGRTKKRITYTESDNDDYDSDMDTPASSSGTNKRQRRRIYSDDDDSGDDFKPDEAIANDLDDDDFNIGDIDWDEDIDDNDQAAPTINRKAAAVSPIQERFKAFTMNSPSSPQKKTTASPKTTTTTTIRTSPFSTTTTTKQEKQQGRNKSFKEKNEIRYNWLADQKDANGNRPDSSDYDPRTLYVPKSAWHNFTPFEKQFWEVKSKNWDSVVFFKKGKFYELYEKDADIGHQAFDLKMTDRVNMRMVGVPESSFNYWAAQFIARGYKVARVDQMENAIGKSLRDRQATDTKADKVIRRELTAVLTAGTLVDGGLLTDDMGTYCMSIKEMCPDENSDPMYGICFVDTATAEFNLVSFQDDKNRTKFETLIMQIKPRELVTEKGRLSTHTNRILKNCLNDPIWNMLHRGSEFWDENRTADEVRIAGYFTGEDVDMESNDSWPPALQQASNTPILMSAVGGLLWYLRSLKLDKELFSARNIQIYDPLQNATSLVLDGQTLANLEIFENTFDGSTEGTVFKLLANSITPFGKRLFRRWLCHPLRRIQDIQDRQDAVQVLMQNSDIRENLASVFGTLPDLERLISRVHSKRCTVSDFLTTLDGFRKAKELIDSLVPLCPSFNSSLLKSLVMNFEPMDDLKYFEEEFEVTELDIDYKKMTVIIPKDGVDEEWDDINNDIAEMKQAFAKHLKDMKAQLRCAQMEYKDLGKEIYQIEVPKNVKVPNDWTAMSKTSKISRYWTPILQQQIPKYKEQLEIKNAYTKNFATVVYGKFDAKYKKWMAAVDQLAHLDALLGLSEGSSKLGEPACRPEFTEQETSVLEFEELRHPCVVAGPTTDFIPNDIKLGDKDEPNITVLTGPNMGGKSTLLRQTCVAIIMAQLGGYVPAKSCRMTACDRIYTRIGANDNIMGGQSTFMVELAETSKILHEATPRSMVILDELGRGTSTFDGYAIAYSVLHYLATHVGCLAMFSTHYHTLCHEFQRNPCIKNMHMGYMMDEDEHRVIFMYKLTQGICEKSFGMNVASMAGIPKSIITKATTIADTFEKTHKRIDSTTRTTGGPRLTPAVLADFAYLLQMTGDDNNKQSGGDTGKQRSKPLRTIIKSFATLES